MEAFSRACPGSCQGCVWASVVSRFGLIHFSLAALGVELPLRASSRFVLGHVFPAKREALCIPDRRQCVCLYVCPCKDCFCLLCAKKRLFSSWRLWELLGRGRVASSLGVLQGSLLGDLCGLGLVSKVYAELPPALLMLHYWSRSPHVCTSNSSLLSWLCSMCWQQAVGYGLAWECNLWSLAWSHRQMLTGSNG